MGMSWEFPVIPLGKYMKIHEGEGKNVRGRGKNMGEGKIWECQVNVPYYP